MIDHSDTEPAPDPPGESHPADLPPPPETAREPVREVSLAQVYAVAVDCAQSMEQTRRDLLGSNGVLERLRLELLGEVTRLRQDLTPAILHAGALVVPSEPPVAVVAPPPRVLVVDDQELTLRAMERVLTMHAMDVIKAANGAEALEVLRAAPVDVLLTDLEMPGNGSTLCKHVADEHPEVIMLLMTGHGVRHASRKALELGAFGYIVKPFEIEELVLTMRSAVELARHRVELAQMKGRVPA